MTLLAYNSPETRLSSGGSWLIASVALLVVFTALLLLPGVDVRVV
jgi:hypothetical protein